LGYNSRETNTTRDSPRPMTAALATKVSGNVAIGCQVDELNNVVLTLQLKATQKVYVTTAYADTVYNTTADADTSAIKLVSNIQPADVVSASSSFWKDYWTQSSISLPTQPAVEAMWYGAVYGIACASSTNPSHPPPGLFGPYVTSDKPQWRGDYTLDYNVEAAYYHVHGVNHAAHARPYWGPFVDWQPAARLQAQQQAALADLKCPATALHYPDHLAPWGVQSTDLSIYMHWNGAFAANLFINDWEYTRNASFARETTYPLLDGLNSWWACFLAYNGTSYSDWNMKIPDQYHENQAVKNPQTGLAWIKRLASAQLDIAKHLNLPAPTYLKDVLQKLVPFNTNSTGDNSVWTSWTDANETESDGMSLYPIWPTEYLTHADSALLPIARRTWATYSNPMKRPVLSFPAAVRAGVTPGTILAAMNKILKKRFQRNLMNYWHGGVTELGVARGVTEMLVQAPNGKYIELFPVWPVDQPATFSTLRTKGAFLVSAAYINGVVQNVSITATVSGPCTVLRPTSWGSKDVSVRCGGTSVAVTWSDNLFTFTGSPGITCAVSPALMFG